MNTPDDEDDYLPPREPPKRRPSRAAVKFLFAAVVVGLVIGFAVRAFTQHLFSDTMKEIKRKR